MKISNQFITDAPSNYDGFGTKTVEVLDFTLRGKQNRLRKVFIPPMAIANNWQINRYYSGLHVCIPASEIENWKDLWLPIESLTTSKIAHQIAGPEPTWKEFLLIHVLESDRWQITAEALDQKEYWVGNLECIDEKRRGTMALAENSRLSLLQKLFEQVYGRNKIEFAEIAPFQVGVWQCRIEQTDEITYEITAGAKGSNIAPRSEKRTDLKAAIELVQIWINGRKSEV
ncbi:hypothetical protein ACQ4M3_07735 [Leptolyngbya sp. AN03gr2]|uniref:hypothetical protein n=1 Tax=unclassified Leptolyngbya TaxID=2650499 RepID=UPI003D31147A